MCHCAERPEAPSSCLVFDGVPVLPQQQVINRSQLERHHQALFFRSRTGASPLWTEGRDEGDTTPQPNGCRPRTRHVGGRRQSRRWSHPDGFAVCAFAATLASYLEICKRHSSAPFILIARCYRARTVHVQGLIVAWRPTRVSRSVHSFDLVPGRMDTRRWLSRCRSDSEESYGEDGDCSFHLTSPSIP